MTRKHYTVSLTEGGLPFTADLFVAGDTCNEVAMVHEAMGGRVIHESEFETANLGSASRDGYARTMLRCVAREYLRSRK